MKKWFFLFCLFSLMSCEYKKEWSMSVSAPQHYGATIEAQYYLGEELLAAIKGAGSPGWGLGTDGLTMGEHDKKPIPDRVKIHCYSAREGVNYTADIPLPKKKMEELFKNKLYDPVSETYNNYNSIVCGCAPGGEIVIWLRGYIFLEEVTRVKGKEISRENQQQREAYFNNKTPKEQEWITNNPIPYGTWDKYDKEFLWKPDVLVYTKGFDGYTLHINYIKGDFEFYNDTRWGGIEQYPKQEWKEINNNKIELKKRNIPFFVELYLWNSKDNSQSQRMQMLLPVKQLKLLFEQGYIVRNKKYNYEYLVFEITKDNGVVLWLQGKDEYKTKVKKLTPFLLNIEE
jgi:lipoprotein